MIGDSIVVNPVHGWRMRKNWSNPVRIARDEFLAGAFNRAEPLRLRIVRPTPNVTGGGVSKHMGRCGLWTP